MRKYVLGFVVGVFLLSFGCAFFTVELNSYEYLGKFDEAIYNETTTTETYLVDSEVFYFSAKNSQIDIKFDNDLDDKIVVESSYMKEFGNLMVNTTSVNNQKIIRFDYNLSISLEEVKKLSKEFVQNMRDQEFYDYAKLFQPKITIYVQNKYKDRIVIGENN